MANIAKSGKEIKPSERVLNVYPSRDTERDWRFKDAIEADLIAELDQIPSSVDLRENWWNIRDQTTHGACVGFAVADSLLRWHFVKKGVLPADKYKSRLSPRFIWMASKELDTYILRPTTMIENAGTYVKDALDVARKYGCVLDKDLGFDPEKMSHESEAVFYSKAAKFKLGAYYNLRKSTDTWSTIVSQWQTWLATKGPIVTRLGVDATWDNATSTGGKLDTYQPSTIRGGHAIALVGYISDRFIVRNSWGTSWGDNGFGYASHQYARDAFPEAYGITV